MNELRCRLVWSIPDPSGIRWRVAFHLLSLMVRLCGVKLVVGAEIENVIGTIEPRTT